MNARHICSKCEYAKRESISVVACTVDGIDIRIHAEKADCPKGYHAGICQRCGGQHNVSVCQIAPDTSPELERRKAQQGGCCGEPKLNQE